MQAPGETGYGLNRPIDRLRDVSPRTSLAFDPARSCPVVAEGTAGTRISPGVAGL